VIQSEGLAQKLTLFEIFLASHKREGNMYPTTSKIESVRSEVKRAVLGEADLNESMDKRRQIQVAMQG
jgi:hypothetical protein